MGLLLCEVDLLIFWEFVVCVDGYNGLNKEDEFVEVDDDILDCMGIGVVFFG